MQVKRKIVWGLVFLLISLILTLVVYIVPYELPSYGSGQLQDITGASIYFEPNKTVEKEFRCEDQLETWLETEEIKTSSAVSISVVEEQSFTDKDDLLSYVSKWEVDNERKVKARINEITKLPELKGSANITNKRNVYLLNYSYEEGEITAMNFVLKEGYLDKKVVCNETFPGSKGVIKCDLSNEPRSKFTGEIYPERVKKSWSGRIDTVLIKEDKISELNDDAVLFLGICDDSKKLFFE